MSEHQDTEPDQVLGLMQKILALCPEGKVEVATRFADGNEWASVIVSHTAVPDGDRGNYPNCVRASGGMVFVDRYADGDVVAAMREALDLISENVAVPA